MMIKTYGRIIPLAIIPKPVTNVSKYHGLPSVKPFHLTAFIKENVNTPRRIDKNVSATENSCLIRSMLSEFGIFYIDIKVKTLVRISILNDF